MSVKLPHQHPDYPPNERAPNATFGSQHKSPLHNQRIPLQHVYCLVSGIAVTSHMFDLAIGVHAAPLSLSNSANNSRTRSRDAS